MPFLRFCAPIGPFVIGLCFTPALLHAQYNGPESVEYDAFGDRYFVSNTGDGTIKQRAQDGAVTAFASVSPSPYGLEILGDTLFACSGGSVKGFLLSSGASVFNLDLGGSFLNGMTTDGTYLYVTDFSAQRIFRVDVAANTFITWVANTAGTPNGIAHHAASDQLLVAFWGSNAPVKAYDRASAALVSTVATSLTNIDGIAVDCSDKVLLASWSPDRITRYEHGVLSPVFENLMVPGLNNPADIDFDGVNNRLCIPNTGTNTVSLFDLDCSTAMPEQRSYTTKVLPNPTAGLVSFDPPLPASEPYMVLDARGLLLAGGTLRPNAKLDISALPSGVYTILLTQSTQQMRVVKQ